MERINGNMFGTDWLKRSEESKARIPSQLKNLIQHMRNITPPKEGKIANVDEGSLYDCQLPGPSLRFDPFVTLEDFHGHLRGSIERDPRLPPEVNYLMTLPGGQWPLVFTHRDLSSLNLLVKGDKVVGVVDWETAGSYPPYWEYATAC